MWAALKLLMTFFVFLCTLKGAFSIVNSDCSQPSCVTTTEVCESDKCVCAEGYINKGDGECVSSECTPGQSACANIANTHCNTDTCVCNVLSGESEADDATKGSCVLKSCENNLECGDATLGMECDMTDTDKVCACKQDLTPTDASCITSGLDAACSGNPQCSGVDNAVCTGGFCKCGSGFADIDGVCKVQAGSSCQVTNDCVTNANCIGSTCTCNENYVDVQGLCKETIGECKTDPAGTCDDPEAVCKTEDQKCYCPDGFVTENSACKIAVGDDCSGKEEKCVSNAVCGDEELCACNEGFTPDGSFCSSPGDRSGGSTQRPFVVTFLVLAVVAALRMWN